MKKISISVLLLSSIVAQMKAQDVKNQFNPVYYGVTSLAVAPDARAGGLGDVPVPVVLVTSVQLQILMSTLSIGTLQSILFV